MANPASGGLPNQPANNYGYDATETSDRGNLTRDNSEGITAIDWTVYGKVAQVSKTTGNITYLYDATGQRVAKTVAGVVTHYIRDANAGETVSNVMAIYENGALKELPIYGSSRLGVYRVLNGDLQNDRNKLILGRREYELANHLGNVLATVSDVKLPAVKVLSFTDYYAFGGAMPGRSGGANYRYGFNTQEKSPELAEGHYTAEFWEYDARIGRRWNLDPVDQISESNYSVNGNNPLFYLDPNGDCKDCPREEIKKDGLTDDQIDAIPEGAYGAITITAQRVANPIPEGYNSHSQVSPFTGEVWRGYSHRDLDVRDFILSDPGVLATAILKAERQGIAQPITYRSAVDYYGGERRLQIMAGLMYAEMASGFMSGGGSLAIHNRPKPNARTTEVELVAMREEAAKQVGKRLQKLTSEAAQEVDALGMGALTPKQQSAVGKTPNLYPTFRGNRIDVKARGWIENDPYLKHLESNYTNGPDFRDRTTGRWWDMTTGPQWKKHVNKYGTKGTLLRTN